MKLFDSRVYANISWLVGDKFIRLGVGVVVSVWIARHLGPESYGHLNYAMAFVTIFGVVSTLGLNGVVVRDLVRDTGSASVTLATSFALQFSLGLLSIALCVLVVFALRPDDRLSLMLVAVLSLSLPFKAAETIKYWFEAQVQGRFYVLAEGFAFIVSSVLRVWFLLIQSTVIAFAWVTAIEAMLAALFLLAIYVWHGNSLRDWRVYQSKAKSLLQESAPLAFSGVAVILYMKVDQIMIGLMIDADAVGKYSAGVRLIEIWYPIPLAIVASTFPSIVRAMSDGTHVYLARLQRLYDIVVTVSVVIALPFSLMSATIVATVFGADYSESSLVLAIYAWVIVFASLSVVSGRWMIDQGLGRLALRRNLMGLSANVVLNFTLVPFWGIEGAALATLVSFAISNYFSDGLSACTRIALMQKSRALAFVWLWRRSVV